MERINNAVKEVLCRFIDVGKDLQENMAEYSFSDILNYSLLSNFKVKQLGMK